MRIVADLHLHSKYSRAVSKDMELETIAKWGDKKGINLMATGDWTHPIWFKGIESKLEENTEGIFKLKQGKSNTKFVLSTEISNIYKQGDQTRRIHTLFMSPGLKTIRKINKELIRRGGNLSSDGRPILGLNLKDMCEIVWGIDERVLVVPAHIWTPWFAMFGSKSGFDSIEECFGEYSDRIYAIETGLSSDPVMNWQIKELENRTIVSFSDAHSPRKLGREATVLEGKNVEEFTFNDLSEAFKSRSKEGNKGNFKIEYTIEFHPEEGKYHYTGHRKCNVVQSPEETKKRGEVCHVCGKKLTLGVMHRVVELAGDFKNIKTIEKINENGVMKYYHPTDQKRPYYMMTVPLQEIISESISVGVNSKAVQNIYEKLIDQLDSEFNVLLFVKIDKIEKVVGGKIAEAIKRVRKGNIVINPGYDGEFGVVKIWGSKNLQGSSQVEKINQQVLF